MGCTERDDVQPKSETDSDQPQFTRSSERLQPDKMSVKQGSERLSSGTLIQVEEEELQNERTRVGQ